MADQTADQPDTWEEHFARLLARIEARMVCDGVHLRKGTGHATDPGLFNWRRCEERASKALEAGIGRDPKTIWNPADPYRRPTLPIVYEKTKP